MAWDAKGALGLCWLTRMLGLFHGYAPQVEPRSSILMTA
jgi:hypothetical protein